MIAAERHEQAIESAAADRGVLAGEVEGSDDELERVGGLAVESRVAKLLDDRRAFFAQERDRGGICRLIGDQLSREPRRVADRRR